MAAEFNGHFIHMRELTEASIVAKSDKEVFLSNGVLVKRLVQTAECQSISDFEGHIFAVFLAAFPLSVVSVPDGEE